MADSAAATVKIRMVKNCPTNISEAIEFIRNKKEAANNISSIDISIIIRCPLLRMIPISPNNNRNKETKLKL